MCIAGRGWKKLLALGCALVLCLLPCLASASTMGPTEPVKPGELLPTRLLQALASGRRLDATFRIGLDDVNPMLGAPAEELDAVRQVLDASELRMSFGMAGDNAEIDLALALGGQEVLTGKAYVLTEGLALETNLLPGKVVMLPLDKMMEALEEGGVSFDGPWADDEMMAVLLQALDTYGTLLMEWGDEVAANNVEVTTQSTPPTDTRDASAMQAKTKVGDDDFSRILRSIVGRFVTDVELQRALASLTGASEQDIAWAGYELLRQLNDSPLKGNQLNVDVYANESGELVGIDYLQLVPMNDDTLGIAFNYGRKNQDAAATDSLRVDIGARDGGGITLDASYSTDHSVPNALTEDYKYHLRVKVGTSYYAQDALVMDGTGRLQAESPTSTTETIKQEVAVTMQASGMDSVSRVNSDISTEALANDDFRSAGHMVLGVGMADMDLVAVSMNWTLASAEFVPTGVEGKTVIDPFTLTDAELAALGEEVQVQLMQAFFSAAGNLPAPLLQMIMDWGGVNL